MVMKGVIGITLISMVGLGASVQAAPAWMLIGSGSTYGVTGVVVREFPSMASCEAVATHIHSLRGTPPEADGLRGIWRTNAKATKFQPHVWTLCIPDDSEIEAVAEPLKAADRYRLLD